MRRGFVCGCKEGKEQSDKPGSCVLISGDGGRRLGLEFEECVGIRVLEGLWGSLRLQGFWWPSCPCMLFTCMLACVGPILRRDFVHCLEILRGRL